MGAEWSVTLGEGSVFCQNSFSYSITFQVSNISSQNPGTANQAPVISAQSNNMSNQVPEVYPQDPVATNQGNLSAEEERQKVMDAAEALLILHNSTEALRETRSTPGTYLDPCMRNRWQGGCWRGWGNRRACADRAVTAVGVLLPSEARASSSSSV